MKVFLEMPDGLVVNMFERRGHDIVTAMDRADTVVFLGGIDINPNLYGEKPHPRAGVHWSDDRDARCLEMFNQAVATKKFNFGICRGSQFLNAVCGGKLWQDVDQHTRSHNMLDLSTNRTIWTSSTHHQMMRLGPDGKALAIANIAKEKISEAGIWYADEHRPDDDIEVAWYENKRALCMQGHPEYPGYEELADYAFELMEKYA